MFSCCMQKAQQPAEETVVVKVQKVALEEPTFGVRTTVDKPASPQQALQALKDGNQRYVDGTDYSGTEAQWRSALATHGQSPMATIIGCADSRCPTDILFDTKPGDLFVLRNAGNTCTHAEGSFVGSIEYSVQHLRVNLIVVLGHTKCGAIAGATKTMLAKQDPKPAVDTCDSVLDVLLADLVPVAEQAQAEKPDAEFDDLAAHAIKVNVFNTVERVIEYSDVVRKKVMAGEVEVHGAIYDLESGKVEFLGKSPRQALLMGSQGTLVGRLNSHASDGTGSCTLSMGRLSEKLGSDRLGSHRPKPVKKASSDAPTAGSNK